jgi:hypothetical protein
VIPGNGQALSAAERESVLTLINTEVVRGPVDRADLGLPALAGFPRRWT